MRSAAGSLGDVRQSGASTRGPAQQQPAYGGPGAVKTRRRATTTTPPLPPACLPACLPSWGMSGHLDDRAPAREAAPLFWGKEGGGAGNEASPREPSSFSITPSRGGGTRWFSSALKTGGWGGGWRQLVGENLGGVPRRRRFMGAGAGGQRVERWSSRRRKCDKWSRVRSKASQTKAWARIPGGVSIAGGNKITVKSHQLATAEATWLSLRVGKMRFLLSCQLILVIILC